MGKSGPGGLETSEFRHHFAEETNRLLRRRLIWFIALWGGFGILLAAYQAVAWITGTSDDWVFTRAFANWTDTQKTVWIGSNALWAAGYISALIFVLGGRLSKSDTVRISMALVILDGLLGVVVPNLAELPGMNIGSSLFVLMFVHFIAALVFPWTPRQAVLPMAVVLVLSAAIVLLNATGTYTGELIFIAMSPLFAVPGTAVAWSKHSRRLEKATLRFVQSRYGMMRQELAYARQIHEALFPRPSTEGDVCFTYRYEPMRQIGGDFLYACTDKKGRTSVVLLDVTGHGVPAALTVNRLHGEVELLFAENPDVSPGEVLRRLNRYVHLTLARHSIYVTALCLRADPGNDRLEYANGGHPPAFLRTADGRIEDLSSTAFVLGACSDDDYDPNQSHVRFSRGDTVVAYTDGATEARCPSGRMVRVDGLRAIVSDKATDRLGLWPEHIIDIVTKHRGDLAPEDDTLIVELYRPRARRAVSDNGFAHAPGAGSPEAAPARLSP